MRTANQAQEFTEQEAAESLGIGMAELHRLLDEYIFNNGTPRPTGLLFTQSDLLLLSYWRGERNNGENLIRMPLRH